MQDSIRSAYARYAPPALATVRRVFERFVPPRVVRWLAVVTTVMMFLVVLMGVTVTNTGSARGCGGSWPLCNGKFIPDFAISTAIEFSHRAVTGVVTILVLALSAAVLHYWRQRLEIRILVPLMIIFLLMQALLGALAVVFNPTPAAILATHFGVSLISFVSVLLTTTFLYGMDSYDQLRDKGVPVAFRNLTLGITAYAFLVVYSGAYVRHGGMETACHGWPLCNGQLFPSLGNGVIINFGHRLLAGALTLGVAWLLLKARELRGARPDLYWGAVAALAAVLLQALVGGVMVLSNLSLVTLLGHGAFVALMFGALSFLVMQTLPRPASVRAGAPVAAAPAAARAR
jgi:heme a synthase